MTLNPTTKRYLLSSLTTFVTVGAATLAAQLSSGTIEWTSSFWVAIVIVVVRAGFKAVIEGFATNHADLPLN